MPSLEMRGFYELKTKKIDDVVTNISPGNYALGYVQEKKTFIVKYVGRSDTDVNDRLKKWVRQNNDYKQFKSVEQPILFLL